MRKIFVAILFIVLVIGCSAGSRSNHPEGMTGTGGAGGAGGTVGTGTAAPTGTVGTGGSAPPDSPGQVIPKETGSTHDDSAITEDVKKSLHDAGFDQIEVETHEGVVTLKGKLDPSQVETVLKLVHTVPNVESVTSKLNTD